MGKALRESTQSERVCVFLPRGGGSAEESDRKMGGSSRVVGWGCRSGRPSVLRGQQGAK